MKRAHILGAGPSGLMAAWAAEQAGYAPLLYDRARTIPDGKSAGVYYLHDDCNIPVLDQPAICETYAAAGTRAGYAEKLYGDPAAPCSWPEERYTTDVWDGMLAMAWLYDRYAARIQHVKVRDVDDIARWSADEPVVSTIPLNVLLPHGQCPYVEALIATGRCDPDAKNVVRYDGRDGRLYPAYRVSCVFGRLAIEYVPGYKMMLNADYNYHYVRKVGRSDIGASTQQEMPENVLLVGRYGRWDKSCLTHHVYYWTMDWLKGI